MALSGDTALVGAFWDDVGANTHQGSAYVFTRSGTTWTQQQHLTASDGAAGDYFGYSVALSGDMALVGALWMMSAQTVTRARPMSLCARDDLDATGQTHCLGRRGGGSVWRFGGALGRYGPGGGRTGTLSAQSGQGSAYVFTRSGTTWTQQAQLTASDGAANDWFGVSVALDGNTALVGAV